MSENFNMEQWLKDFIDTAQYHYLRAYQMQRASGFVEALRTPITKVPDEVLTHEYYKGRADEAEADIFTEMLKNYREFSEAHGKQKGASK